MKYFLTLCLVASAFITSAQDFYDMDAIQTIELTFAESNWDQLMDAAYSADAGYIMAQSVTINGVTMDSVGVKYKGNSSYRSTQAKNPWHIELDTYKDNEYDGYTDIKLANGYKDPSFVRDVLAYQIVRQYMEAPQANFANLYVNGELIGLYANTESISKKFMNSRFGSKNNTRFKCSPPDGAGPQATNLPRLVYLGADSTDYFSAYELKSEAGWQDLIDLCDTLANHTDAVEEILDVDRALWMLAFDNTIVNLDSYIGAFAQNYYLYRSDQGQFMPIVWDLNESFGVFSMTGSSSLNNTTAKQQMTYLLHANDSSYPLVQKLLAVPTYRRMYVAHMKTILEENFQSGSYYDTAEALQAKIDDAVQADDNKFFTYANFTSSLDTDISSGRDRTPGIASLMEGRTTYLLGQNDFTATAPAVSDVSLSTTNPSIGEEVAITAAISDVSAVFLHHRDAQGTTPFTAVEMFDDGAHGDGVANDGVFGAILNVESTTTDYYIYAENDDAGLFAPRRAAHEFYSFEAAFTGSTDGVVINEFMASNDATIADQDGDFDDWIELYNNDNVAVDLSGFYLTDDGTDLTQWSFPAGTEIAAGGYLIVWADDETDQVGLHANFKLSGSGESIILSDTDLTTVDAIDYPEQTTDVSYARIPNGTGEFEATPPTFNDNNDGGVDCTAAGGDSDNDGVCADVDCDDNDPSIGAMQAAGTACDDGDSSTQNDVILADGCTCVGTITSVDGVVINEFMASNDETVTDPDGEFEDWIELYNNDSVAIDLSGYHLTDDGMDLTKWVFPAGTSIASGGYLIIWADGDEDQEGLHANFKLSGSGEPVILSNTDSIVVDAIVYPEQTADVSYARIPNGTGDFEAAPPTFNDNNDSGVDCTDAGGDSDNDGVCADVDCDDNDPSVGAMQAAGTACDDGDSSTQNDVILADGCTCEGTPTALSNVVINEFMASNAVTVVDQDGDFDDWIELYNNDDVDVDLSGYFLSDDTEELTKWTFPAGTTITAGGYLIVWADEDLDQEGLHADFKLSAGGESVLLSTSDTTVIDALDYPEQVEDVSYGRFPNGTGDFQAMTPTFSAENTMSTSVDEEVLTEEDVIVYPNPSIDYVTIEALQLEATDKTVVVQDITGAVVYKGTLAVRTSINTSSWASGMYVVRVEGLSIKLFVL